MLYASGGNLIRQFGADKVVLDSDYLAGMGNWTPAAALAAVTGLSPAEATAIAHENATQLFGLGGALIVR